MSRAIHKMRGVTSAPIEVVKTSFGNINSTPGSSATFSTIDVGTGTDRTLIVGVTIEDNDAATEADFCTVDGNACTRRVDKDRGNTDQVCTAIFTRKLTTETGNVDIVVGASNPSSSFGMSMIVVTGMRSETPTDIATGVNAGQTFVSSSTTLDGQTGGVAVGVVARLGDNAVLSWGSSLTERADIATSGDPGDHRHGFAYDLLPLGRSASTETVSWAGNDAAVLCTASFR